jgi:hypothetical protein
MQKFLCKNHTDCQIKFDGHSVPSGAYYGQTAEGLRFIAVVRVNQIGMVWRSGKGLVPWEKAYNQTVVDFIKSERITKNPEVRYFDKNDPIETQNAQRYNHRFNNCYECGFVPKSKKPAKHTKAFRTRPNCYTAEYNHASSAIYGETIEMNGKPQKVRGKIAEYMDGSGAGKIHGDMRPLEPVFPVPSGKKAR